MDRRLSEKNRNELDAQHAAVLRSRDRRGLLRRLRVAAAGSADFSSNDYLGLGRSEQVHNLFVAQLSNSIVPPSASESISKSVPKLKSAFDIPASGLSTITTMGVRNGSGGSRLLAGDSHVARALESRLAAFHDASSALLFNSGWDANSAMLAVASHEHGSILFDELIHASMHEGLRRVRPSVAVESFRHNNTKSLASLVDQHCKRITASPNPTAGILVVVEALYSMDGDCAPLPEIVAIKRRLGDRAGGIHIIVDEAHSSGVCGQNGRGLVYQFNLQSDIYARLHTFGKALGQHGAVVLCSPIFREYLINYARPLIYSTSLPYHSLTAINVAYDVLEQRADELQDGLRALILHFRSTLTAKIFPLGMSAIDSQTPIQGIIISGNDRVSLVCERLQSAGYDVRPIRSPTVPKGSERLRICLHAYNTVAEIDGLISEIQAALIIEESEFGSKGEKRLGKFQTGGGQFVNGLATSKL
ncbi:hypothetical protein HK100_011683 [Physocladia obscura]|uniref:Aminotransferase class I/classII large domain-containing protein n=1 Tax=Physocladia obscura TaxID=109957 RepID=A0AAD5XI52_9FUNG|nr:hypothetical protein HK100_011683 [Physocladia obscura]